MEAFHGRPAMNDCMERCGKARPGRQTLPGSQALGSSGKSMYHLDHVNSILSLHGPQLEFQPGEFAGYVDGKSGGITGLLPYCTGPVEFEISFSGMVRYLPRRYRQGVQSYSRKGGIHQFSYLLDRTHLDLADQPPLHRFGRHVGLGRENERVF